RPLDAYLKEAGRSSANVRLFSARQAARVTRPRDYWQCGFLIPKGGFDEIKTRGLPQFQNHIVHFAGFLRGRVSELDDWSKIKLLTVQINRLRDWCRNGLLCIGDSAHAMSPAGGVGINLAIQDAVATANLLADKLRNGAVS